MSDERAYAAGDFVERTDQRDADVRWGRLESEIVLPTQLPDRRLADRQPEKRLMLAVLESAVAVLLKRPSPRNAKERRALREARAWFVAPSSAWPFSFRRICDALGLEAEYLRAGLDRAREDWADETEPSVRRLVRPMAGMRHRVGTHSG